MEKEAGFWTRYITKNGLMALDELLLRRRLDVLTYAACPCRPPLLSHSQLECLVLSRIRTDIGIKAN